MFPARAILIAFLLVALGTWFAITGRRLAAQQTRDSAPLEVTTDTQEYCLYLQERVQNLVRVASSPPPREATQLSTEGQRMCEHGQTRGGIMRLRRALMLISQDGNAAQR
jgi:hypothetical protein